MAHRPNAIPAASPVAARNGFVLSRSRTSCVSPSTASGSTAMASTNRAAVSLIRAQHGAYFEFHDLFFRGFHQRERALAITRRFHRVTRARTGQDHWRRKNFRHGHLQRDRLNARRCED